MLCFEDDAECELLDHEPFKLHHKLLGHPALSLENLASVIPALPRKRVLYSMRRLKNGDDFETTFRSRPAERSIEEVIGTIRVSDSYVMVSGPEVDPSFASLYRQLLADVETFMRRRGVGKTAIDPQLCLFIASPGSVTPFHINRYSTFLMQFRGTKEVTVFPSWDERVVSSMHREAYVTHANTRLPWSEKTNALGTRFEFSPGDALHIPFVAGHHVRNGHRDVSISMSIIFNTEQSMAWRRALSFNHHSRKVLSRLGMTPTPVGQQPVRDAAKSQLWKAMGHAKALIP